MRQLLKKLRYDELYYPGSSQFNHQTSVAQSGMMREYITRFHNRDKVVYLHPLFERHLSETFRGNGVPGRCDKRLRITLPSLSLGEADILRRAQCKYRSNNKFRHIKINTWILSQPWTFR